MTPLSTIKLYLSSMILL